MEIQMDDLDDNTQPSSKNAFVMLNNQDSVLMSMSIPDDQRLCLLHDNRIYAFKLQEVDEVSSSSTEQNVILNLLTTPKYRAMGVMYIIFRLLDNSILLLLLILSALNLYFTIPTAAQLALISAIGLDVFYEAMLYTHRYWILQRLSIYIGILLYFIYGIIITVKYFNNEYDKKPSTGLGKLVEPSELTTVIAAVATRFVAFILEECVDIAIDGELHNDLLKLQALNGTVQNQENTNERQGLLNEKQIDRCSRCCDSCCYNCCGCLYKLFGFLCCCYCCCSNWLDARLAFLKEYFDIKEKVKMPHNVEYRGSFFAWSTKSVFNRQNWNLDKFPFWLICLLCSIPFVLTLIVLTLIFILCLIVIAFFALFYLICCRSVLNLTDFRRELFHF